MKRKILAILMAAIMLTSCNNSAQPQNTATPVVENTAAVSENGNQEESKDAAGADSQQGSMEAQSTASAATDNTGADNANGTVTFADYEYNQKLNVIDDNYRTYYEVFLYSYYDSDGDGIGDINGLISKLDYINDGDDNTDTDLGCNGIWLMPVMPSATYHKYDVTDYYGIDPEYGTLDDFKNLMSECRKRGIKLIIDLPMNHTSTKNDWFVKATEYLKSLKPGEELNLKDCPYVEYYNFKRKEDAIGGTYYQIEDTDWYYEAVFWDQMPDLNLGCKSLRREFENIADFWLSLGVGGFRLDAAKEFYSGSAEKNINVLKWFAKYVKAQNKKNYLVAEVWEGSSSYTQYYKSGIDSTFDFDFGDSTGIIATTANGKNHSYTGKAFGQAVINMQKKIQKVNKKGIDAPFFTNHDTGRAAGFLWYKPENIKMAWAMNLFMSGSAFLYYGEELGMSGSGIDENKRAPMYWSNENTEGMTKGPENMEKVEHKFEPLDKQAEDPFSIFNFVKRTIRIRNENPEIARGTASYMKEIKDDDICALAKTYKKSTIYLLYNFADEEKKVKVNKDTYKYKGIRGYLTTTGEAVTIDGDEVTLPTKSVVVLK